MTTSILRSCMTVFAIGLVAASAGRAAHGQEQSPVSKPTKEHELLKQDVGTWDAIVKVWPMKDAEPMESKGTEKNELLKGGLWLVSRFEGEAGGIPFVGVGVSGYNPKEKKYVGTWADSMSPHLMITKSEYDPETKTMTGTAEAHDPYTGEPYTAKLISRYEDDDKRVFELHMPGDDGEYWKMLEIEYERSDD